MVDAKRKFKVLCPKGRSPLKESSPKYPHITACITIGAAGDIIKPMLILPNNKKKLKDMDQFEGKAYFASSESGWMNKSLFMYWAMIFVAEMSKYRLFLPQQLRNQRILLILDGHKSRANYFVANLLDSYGIDVLILPGHTSHLLQPFDVSIASPLKSKFQENISNYDRRHKDGNGIGRNKSLNDIRIMMIECFINALSESANMTNIKSGFRASGIFPLNPEVPLASKYSMDSSLRDKFPSIYQKIKNGNMVNNHHLNGNLENLLFIFRADYGIIPINDHLPIFYEAARQNIEKMKTGKNANGIILSPIPDIIDENNDGIRRIANDGKLR